MGRSTDNESHQSQNFLTEEVLLIQIGRTPIHLQMTPQEGRLGIGRSDQSIKNRKIQSQKIKIRNLPHALLPPPGPNPRAVNANDVKRKRRLKSKSVSYNHLLLLYAQL